MDKKCESKVHKRETKLGYRLCVFTFKHLFTFSSLQSSILSQAYESLLIYNLDDACRHTFFSVLLE